MDPVFLLNGCHSAHVGLWLRPDLGCFGEEVFKSRRSDIDENADWLIRIIFKTVDRAAGGINGRLDLCYGGPCDVGSDEERMNLGDSQKLISAVLLMQCFCTTRECIRVWLRHQDSSTDQLGAPRPDRCH
jgi:hypothetical protein